MPALKVEFPGELSESDEAGIRQLAKGRHICLHCRHFVPGKARWRDGEVQWHDYTPDKPFHHTVLRVLASAIEWVGGCRVRADMTPCDKDNLTQTFKRVRWNTIYCGQFSPLPAEKEGSR